MPKPAVAALNELREMNGQRFISAAESPVRPILWRVLVQPLPPKRNSEGGIMLAEETTIAEEMVTCIGKVIDHGDFFFKSKTNAGLVLSDDGRKPVIGDYVLFGDYAGKLIELKDSQKTKLRILDDTEILGVVTDPEAIKRYT